MNILSLLKTKGEVAFLYEDYTLRQGLEKMKAHGYTAIPVLSRDGHYVGSVNEGDFLWHILGTGQSEMKAQESEPISSIIRSGWSPSVRIDVTPDDLLDKAAQQNFVPIVDDRDLFIGIITRQSIIDYFRKKGAGEKCPRTTQSNKRV